MLSFIINSILLGVGLAMDAFSVSIANGLSEPGMSKSRMGIIAGTYGGFQFLMPMIGWLCVRTIAAAFQAFSRWIPWIALVLLLYIGGKMLLEGIREQHTSQDSPAKGTQRKRLGAGTLLLQGVATSIDALSVGFTIAKYQTGSALLCSSLIAVVTFGICMSGLLFGKKFGERFAGKATILGGLILIGIGLEIFLRR